MSKPFFVKQIEETRIAIQTRDAVSSVVLDQAAAQNTIAIETTDVTAGVIVASGSENTALQCFDGDIFAFTPGGNMISTAAQLLENGSSLHQQTMVTASNRVTLSPAAAVYNELNEALAPGLNVASRINIGPPAGGTVINSIVFGSGNVDGRQLWIQNVSGTVGETLTLTNQSGAGTVGGQFQSPGDFVIPPGGGASIMFDASALGGVGAWLVRGI